MVGVGFGVLVGVAVGDVVGVAVGDVVARVILKDNLQILSFAASGSLSGLVGETEVCLN